MDIGSIINPASGVERGYTQPVKAASNSQPSPQADLTEPHSVFDPSDPLNKYAEAIKVLAELMQDFYPLGDKKVAFFKDNTGHYIIRYVSLRDGSITYVPSEILFRQAHSTENSGLHVEISA